MFRDPLKGFHGGYGDCRGMAATQDLEKPMYIHRAWDLGLGYLRILRLRGFRTAWV